MTERISLFLGRVRWMFHPLALFSILAVGLHVGSNRLDDHLFVVVNALDAWADAAMTLVIREVFSWFGASAQTIDALTFRAVDLVDLEAKTTIARFLALVFELASDFVLALPVFFYRPGDADLRTTAHRFFRSMKDPTILKVAAPLAVTLAGVAGVFAVSREMQVLAHSLSSRLISDAHVTSAIAAVFGLIALVVVFWRIALPAMLSAVGYAERIASNELVSAVPARRRRMRGLFVAFFAVPIAVLAIDATSIFGAVRGLVSW